VLLNGTETPLMTISEVADVLRCHERTVRRLVCGGLLPCVRIGRSLRFHREAVSRWIAEGGTAGLDLVRSRRHS